MREVPATPQTLSPSYRLAFADTEFLLREELRPVRLQLELLKPELELLARGIESTIVTFGSARIRSRPRRASVARRPRPRARAAPGDRGAGSWRPGLPPTSSACRATTTRPGASPSWSRPRAGPTASSATSSSPAAAPGIMEAANRGAAEVGAISIGHNIVLPHEQAPNPWITPELCFQFHYFALRKMHLMTRAKALVVFPGGFGTLDELFEILCLIQTGKSRPMPVLLFDRAYWRGWSASRRWSSEGVVDARDLGLFSFVETAEEAWSRIEARYAGEPS